MLQKYIIASFFLMTTSCTLPNNTSNDSELSAALTSGPLPATGGTRSRKRSVWRHQFDC